MSYLSDHIAWQQRVSQESKASKRFFDYFINNPSNPNFAPEAVRFYQNLERSMQGSRYSRFTAVSPNNRPQTAHIGKAFKNKQIYTFGGRTPNSQKKLRRIVNETEPAAPELAETNRTYDAHPPLEQGVLPEHAGTPEFKDSRPYVGRSMLLQHTGKLQRPRSSGRPGALISRKANRFNEELGSKVSKPAGGGTKSLRNIRAARDV